MTLFDVFLSYYSAANCQNIVMP